MKKSKALINKTDWFKELVDEIKAIAVETIFNARIEIITGKWLIGKTIEEALQDKTREEVYGKGINTLISEQIRWSEREIARCRQFYNKYPVKDADELMSKLPGGKNLTWHKITTTLLPKTKPIKEREYISIRVDIDNKTLYIKSDYKNFKIKWYD